MSAAGLADAAAALSPVGHRFRWNGRTHFGNDGLIWWLGTRGGTGEYQNPGTDAELEPGESKVKIESTGICCNSVRSFLRRRNGLGSTQDHGLNTHVTITLPTPLVPTHYSIMHGMYEDEQVPRSWQLKGSNDGVRWTVLRDHVNDVSLGRGAYLKQTWALDSGVVGSYTRFRIQMTGPNGYGPEAAKRKEDDYVDNYQLVFSGIEFYGVCPVPVVVSRSSSSSKLGIAKLEVDGEMLIIAKLKGGSPAARVLKPGDRVVCVNDLAAPFAHKDVLAAAVANNPNGKSVVIRKAAASEIKRNPFSDLRLWLLPADDGLSEAVADKTSLQHPRLVMRARKLSSQDSGTESLDSQYEYAQQTILQPRHEDSLEETQESSLGIDTRTPSAVVPTIAVNPVPITQAKAGTSSPHTGTLAHRNPGAPPTASEMPAAASAPAVESVASASAAKAKATAVQSRSPAPSACNPPLATMRPVQTGYFQSSILLRYEHAAAAKILILVTKRGDAYRYSNVDASVVQGLQDAASAGTFWNKHLKKKYLETKVGTKSKPHAPLSSGDPDGNDSSTTGSSMLTTASKRPRTAICGSLGTKPVHCTAIGAASGPAAGTAVEESLGTKPASPRAASISPARNPKAIALPSQSVLASLPTLGSSRNAAATDGACPAVTSSLSGAELLTGRTFTFSGEDFDGEGVLYWLGTHGKTAGYQNPATCAQCRGGAAAAHCALPHCVRVTSTAISDGDSHLFVEHQFANQNWTVDDKTSTFFAVELPAPLSITHYTLRHGDKEDFAYSLRNWVLEGSADGKVRCSAALD